MTENKSSNKIYINLCNAMSEIDVVAKEQLNRQQNFKFRGIDDIYNKLHPILSKHHIFFAIDEIIESKSEEKQTRSSTGILRSFIIKYRIYTDDGSFIYFTIPAEAMDYGDKATSKALSIAHKYLLIQLFAIPTNDMADPDQESFVIEKENLQSFHSIPETLFNEYADKLRQSKTLEELKNNFIVSIQACLKAKDKDSEDKLTIIKEECKASFLKKEASQQTYLPWEN